MRLLPLADPVLIESACAWLADPCNARWLQFGDGTRPITPAALKVMTQRPAHLIRVFTDDTDRPIGVVALGDIHPTFRTASVWVVLGDKALAGRHYGRRAMAECIRLGFEELQLRAITTWVVDANIPSLRMLHALGFRPIGTQRQSHVIEGRTHDRLLFDLLPGELRDV